LRAQIELWRSHDLLIATLGSDLTNMVYARRGTRVLVLAPHWFGDGFFFELSVAAGVRWHELRCGEMTSRDEEAERFSSFAVDVKLLDFILTSLL
jgi:capsular polysaccharide biosynthesis protein